MATQATRDLAIKTGEYNDRSTGEVKARWLKIGTVFRHDDLGARDSPLLQTNGG